MPSGRWDLCPARRSAQARVGGKKVRILTMKFGGTSVGSPEALSQAAEIVLTTAQKWEGVVVVVSAATGGTDALMTGARTAAGGDGHTYMEIEGDLPRRPP